MEGGVTQHDRTFTIMQEETTKNDSVIQVMVVWSALVEGYRTDDSLGWEGKHFQEQLEDQLPSTKTHQINEVINGPWGGCNAFFAFHITGICLD